MTSSALSKLKKVVFNGILAQEDLRNLENQGLGLRTPLSPAAKIQETDFSPILIHDAAKMASVYAIFYCLENSVRELISDRLSLRHGAGWWDNTACVSGNIKKAAETLKQKEEKNKYHVARSSDMIGYTLFNNLAQIIINDWEDFSDLFPDQHWVSSRLNDLELSRNVIMHTSTLHFLI